MHKNADWYLISSLFFVCQMSTSISCLPAFTSACLKGCFYMCPSQGLFLHLPFSKGVFTAVCLKGCFYICLSQGLFLHLSASRGDFTSVCLKGWFYICPSQGLFLHLSASRGDFTSVCLKGCFYICPSQGVFLHLSQGVFFTSVSRGVFTSVRLKGCFLHLSQGVFLHLPASRGERVPHCTGTSGLWWQLSYSGTEFPSHPPDDFVGLAVCLWAGADGLAGRCQKLQAFLQVYGAVLSHGILNDFGWNQRRLSVNAFGQYVRCKESMRRNP